jgi:signal transduction histidine kinase
MVRLRAAWRSLGLRIVLLFLLLAVAIVLIGAGGMQRAVGGPWRALVRPLVADYVDRLAAEIGSPPDAARARALAERLPLTVRISGPVVQWDSRGDTTLSPSQPVRPPGSRMGGASQGEAPWHLREPSRWSMGRGMHRHFPALDEDGDAADAADAERGWLMARRLTADGHVLLFGIAQVPWRDRPRSIGWFTVGLLAVLTLVAYGVVRHWLRPLSDIASGAERYGAGKFDAPIPQRRDDELGELAGRINTMASRLHGMLEAKRALLLAISHELRSPLTRARLNAELVDDGPSRDALLRDLGEMRELITDLLESERLAAGHAALQREPTDLAALVRAVVAELGPEGGAARIDVRLDEALGPVDVDPARWRVLLRNLLSNALRHGRPEEAQGLQAVAGRGPDIELSLARVGDALRLTVRDHGPGVPPEQLARLTEAFYRPDSDRGRRSGGVGLGLHLCRLIAEAHGGQLTLAAAEPGLRATVAWPLCEPG